MRKLWLSSFLPLLLSLTVHSQQAPPSPQPGGPPPTQAQYTAALRNVITNEAQWRKTIEGVKIEDLSVSYATGKEFQESKYLVIKGLNLAALWADRTNREPSLFAEVSFLSAIEQLQGDFMVFTATMDEYQLTDTTTQKKVNDWLDALSDLANGPIQQTWVVSYTYTTHRAYLLDQSCRASKP